MIPFPDLIPPRKPRETNPHGSVYPPYIWPSGSAFWFLIFGLLVFNYLAFWIRPKGPTSTCFITFSNLTILKFHNFGFQPVQNIKKRKMFFPAHFKLLVQKSELARNTPSSTSLVPAWNRK